MYAIGKYHAVILFEFLFFPEEVRSVCSGEEARMRRQ
jgi:hypothetical protein